MLFFIILVAVLLLLAAWLLLAPFELEMDTRVPRLRVEWKTVGWAEITYAEGWKAVYSVLFFKKKIALPPGTKTEKEVSPKKRKKKSRRKMKPAKLLGKISRVLSSFRVREWNWALDTGDHALNAQLYPANYLPRLRGHLQVNFGSVNYFSCRVQNRPWRVIYAWLKG